MDLTANEKAVHADFFNGKKQTFRLCKTVSLILLFVIEFEDLYDDDDLA